MDGLMMDYQLNVPAILRRADELYGDNEIASRLPDKSWHRYTYADFVSRTKKLVVALRKLGLEDGDRVGTFMWNHSQHLETYMGAPVGGFVTHTLNLRLHPDDNTYIATHGGDRVLIVDKVLWPLAEQFVAALRLRARDRGRRRARRPTARSTTRSSSRTPTSRRSRTATSPRAPRRRCVTRAAPPGGRRASSTRTARSRSTR